ncbi:MAG: DNA polymerase III subunit delta [Leptolyngbya sp. IPPAS B-1204]|jgi:DNA polymerase-3 subunit delta|nr:DNA polymerase III subunit delta [Elainella sp. C42_A2020_010]RNJ70233.1 MAG: DNA polymerase III subunit delta [Leptolyngbya sp. IPPAS B-1204]
MSIYLYWGDDDFAMERAVATLRQQFLDPAWADFNYSKIIADQVDALIQGLNLAVTPPFGAGCRFVWLAETTLCQRCPESLLIELERTIPVLPAETVLLFTTSSKPDGRLKSTKLLQNHAEIREFSTIPPWSTDQIARQVRQAAADLNVKLTPGAVSLLTESVGNHSRQLYSELEKLRLYAGNSQRPLDETAVADLITTSTQSSLQLATAIRLGDTAKALSLVRDLLNRNEPALRIVQTLVGYFRTRLWVKLMLEAGERNDREIARLAEVNNPKQIYFLQQEVKPIPLAALLQALPMLLELEFRLKSGADTLETLQIKVIELCQLYDKAR